MGKNDSITPKMSHIIGSNMSGSYKLILTSFFKDKKKSTTIFFPCKTDGHKLDEASSSV